MVDDFTVNVGKVDYTPTGRIASNDDGWVAATTRPMDDFPGKFFPSGMRGYIDQLNVRLFNAAGLTTVTWYISPRPGVAAVLTDTFALAGWNGSFTTNIGSFWDYDSLFIWFSEPLGDVRIYYDTPTPTTLCDSFDGNGVDIWITMFTRLHLRLTMYTQAPYPVPIEGTVSVKDIDAGTGLIGINRWGAVAPTALTSRDISLDLKTLTDSFLTDAFRSNMKYWNGTALNAPVLPTVAGQANATIPRVYGHLGLYSAGSDKWFPALCNEPGYQRVDIYSLGSTALVGGDPLKTLPMAGSRTTIRKANNVINNSNTIYTVTAGKIFYLASAFLSAHAYAVSVSGDGFLEVDTAGNGVYVVLMELGVTTFAGATQGAFQSCSLSPAAALPFSAGSVFRVRSNKASLYAAATIQGWED